MTDEVQAEPVEQEVQESPVVEEAESAPAVEAEVEAVAETPEASAPNQDAIQARINKITAQKHEERRAREAAEARAAELQAQLEQSALNQPASPVPTLDQFDYDEGAYQAALSEYNRQEIQREVQKTLMQSQAEQQRQAEIQRVQALEVDFLEKARALSARNPDVGDTLAAIPTLPDATYEAIIQSPKGAEVAYYLGKHLDVADALIGMNPVQAGRELARIESMFQGTSKPVTNAPPPPQTVGGSATPTQDPYLNADSMSMEEFYKATSR